MLIRPPRRPPPPLPPPPKSVDVFAAKIRADPKLANGFNAVGFSQGNSLIRGYIQKYVRVRRSDYELGKGTGQPQYM
jgi:hypothetical protein